MQGEDFMNKQSEGLNAWLEATAAFVKQTRDDAGKPTPRNISDAVKLLGIINVLLAYVQDASRTNPKALETLNKAEGVTKWA
jgi:hypothetical protein